jgi:hypothetical protein
LEEIVHVLNADIRFLISGVLPVTSGSVLNAGPLWCGLRYKVL